MTSSPSATTAFSQPGPDLDSFIQATRQLLAAAGTPGAEAAARTFTEFLRDRYAAIGLPIDGTSAHTAFANRFPAMGSTRHYQERAQRLTEAGLRYAEAQRRLQRICSDVLSEAATRFAAGVVKAAPGQQTAAPFHALFNQWIDSAEEAYSRAAHGEPFCNALADSVNALSEWRRDMQASIEDSAKLFDLPTRSELDGLARRVKVLEAELRATRADGGAPKTARRRSARATSKP